jgi:2-polyprenyl-6-methoxyphenol hydroxylase-like FAD-dependent oxidoreductase
MLDAAALADVILESHAAYRDIGARRYLRLYERWRRGENALMLAAFDSFFHIFKPQPEPVLWLRSTALNIVNHGGPLKRFVMGHAMGTRGNLPALARTR